MEQEQTPKQVQPEDTESNQIEERDAKREFNILVKLLRHPHEAGAFAEVGLVSIFVATLGSLFLLRLRLGTGRRPQVMVPFRGLRIGPPGVGLGLPPDLCWFLSRFFFSGPLRPPPLPCNWPLPRPLDFPLPLSPLPLPP